MKKPKKSKWTPAEVGILYDDWHVYYMEHYGDTVQAHRSKDTEIMHRYTMESAGIRDGMKILDAGCGVCGPSVYFASHKDVFIEAVTVSKRQAEDARQRVDDAGLSKKVRIHHGDFHKLEMLFGKNVFDLVLFLESYGHSYDHNKAIHSAAAVLKPGGILYLKDYFKKELSSDPGKAKLMKLGLQNMNKVYRYNTADLYFTLSVLRKLGIELITVRKPAYEWDNTKVVNAFEASLGIDLFKGNDRPEIVEPFELLFRKPL